MLGSFVSDSVEKKFGKLGQRSGVTHFISVEQVLEKVSIFKTKLLLRYEDFDVLKAESHSCDKCGFLLTENLCNVIDNLPNLEKSLSMDCIMALVYISGYIMRNDSITEDSHFYFEKYGNFLNEMNRGGLKIPGDSMCQWVIFCYIVFHEVNEKTCRTSLSKIKVLSREVGRFYFLNSQFQSMN